jgi:hypothetical protein
MPSAAVETVIRTRLAANWNTANGVILEPNGQSEPPSDGSSFLVIHYPVGNSVRPTLTRRRFEEGAARIILNVPKGVLLSASLPLADTIAALFRGDKLIVDHVEFMEPSLPFISDDNDEGNYYELAVIVPYRYQFDVA